MTALYNDLTVDGVWFLGGIIGGDDKSFHSQRLWWMQLKKAFKSPNVIYVHIVSSPSKFHSWCYNSCSIHTMGLEAHYSLGPVEQSDTTYPLSVSMPVELNPACLDKDPYKSSELTRIKTHLNLSTSFKTTFTISISIGAFNKKKVTSFVTRKGVPL